VGKAKASDRSEAAVSIIYEWIGRLVVGLVWRVYGREIRAAGAVAAVAALVAGAYIATRGGEDES
jgi:hypothetical protein